MEWFAFYNKKRVHGSLKMMSPLDLTRKFHAEEVTMENVVA